MEEPIHHDHLEHRTRPGLGNAFAVHAGGIDGVKIHAGDPIHELLDIETLSGPFPIDLRNDDLVVAFEIGRDVLGIMTFGHEVELVLQRLHELLDDLLRAIGGQLRHILFSQRRQIGQQAHVRFDLGPDPGALNLEHHGGSVFQRRSVNLGN